MPCKTGQESLATLVHDRDDFVARCAHRIAKDMRAAMSKLPIDALTIRRIAVGLALLGTVPLVSGCAETIIGAGATGAVAASQERGLGGAVGDTQIRTAINYLWLDDDANMYHHLNLNVQEGRVMITGVVARQEQRDK